MPVRASIIALAAACIAGASACTSTRTADTVTFKVGGMACPNCAKHIAEELEEIPGVRSASIDFDSATARVQLDPQRPASRESLDAAVAKWRKEHFAAKEDPECLDPTKREELRRVGR
ncbi:MAG: cation transporter [Phycisphaerales bacterium]